MDAAKALAPAQASSNSRLMLSQSLMHSAAKVYSASWRAVAAEEAATLDSMSESACTAALAAMESAPLATLLAPVNKRFLTAFGAISASAQEFFSEPANQAKASQRPAAPTPKPR
jgi:hypothetical protein